MKKKEICKMKRMKLMEMKNNVFIVLLYNYIRNYKFIPII